MRQQLIDLRRRMRETHLDAYLVPTTDFHGSEYVNDHFKCRQFLSGFTGSAGTLLVTADDAMLWTDGRYFLQAEAQLAGSGIRLMKAQTPGVPSIFDHLRAQSADGPVRLGFDGRVVDARTGEQLADICQVVYDLDLVGDIWQDRPPIRPSGIYRLPVTVTGESTASKLARLRSQMAAVGADCHLMTSLEEIAWLFNLRGSDVVHTPVFFAFACITAEDARLYVLDTTLTRVEGATLCPYLQIFEDVRTLRAGTCLLDPSLVSYSLLRMLPETVKPLRQADPVLLMKALKNPTEIRCTKAAHLRDGAAMVQFLYWLKTQIGRQPLTELDAVSRLADCRRAQAGFRDLSFSTIAGYGPHGAIIHYDPTPETDLALEPAGFLLVDSGGQYTDGTTDITRTIALGPLTEEMRVHYTLVLRAHIALARARFPAGTTGGALDAIARRPLHDAGVDFAHGTGHGVGHLLSVHEGPQRIAPAGSDFPFYPGMITSDEPGLYFADQYGIRLENELLCVEQSTGQCAFETITFCPFDREAILPQMLLPEERAWLDQYHAAVYDALAPALDPPVRQWLHTATAPL